MATESGAGVSIELERLTSQRAGSSTSGQSADLVLSELRSLKTDLNKSIKDISTKVDKLSETVYGPSVLKRSAETVSENWADDTSTVLDRPPPQWSDEEVDDERVGGGTGTIKLSEHNERIVSSAFSSALPNTERRRVRNAYATTALPDTRCPRLDPVFKASLNKSGAKAVDAELARVQAFVLDPVAPLVHLLHKLDDEEFTVEEARMATQDALRLLGNASAQISTMRRRKVLKNLNPKLQDMADEPELFSAAAPQLFGQGFESKMKERAKSLKILSTARSTSPPPKRRKFFPGSRPSAPSRGGGQFSRGGRQWQSRDRTATRK